MGEINELWNNALKGKLQNKEIVKHENKEQTPINFKGMPQNITIGQLQEIERNERATLE